MNEGNYLERTRWDWAYLVECKLCGWYNISQDYEWTKNAGKAHIYSLAPDHELVSSEPRNVKNDTFGLLGWRDE